MNFDTVCVLNHSLQCEFSIFHRVAYRGFPSQRDSISQSVKHHFRLPESAIEIYAKIQKLFVLVRMYCNPCFSGFYATTITDSGFIFERVYTNMRIHLRIQPCSCDRSERFVRRRRGRGLDRVKCFPAAVERPRACKSDVATSVRYAARNGTFTCAITCTVHPLVSMPLGIVRRAESSLSETLEQIALNAWHTMYVRVRQLTRIGYQSVTHMYGRIVSIAIDEIISAASSRVIGTFRGARNVFPATSTGLSIDMYFSRFEDDWPSDESYRVHICSNQVCSTCGLVI